jgi:hypothetical protein
MIWLGTHKGPQVGGMYVPMFKLENKPLTKWAPPNGPKKVHKGPQLGGVFVTMSKLENKPLIESLGPFF